MPDPATLARLWSPTEAFADQMTWILCAGIGVAFVVFGVLIVALARTQRVDEKTADELWKRWVSWCWIIAAILVPILLGPGPTILAVCVLGMLCFREFAHAVELEGERLLCGVAIGAVCLVAFASLDHWVRLFFASAPIGVLFLMMATLPNDQPAGYIRRTALASTGYLLFGFCLGYLGLMAHAAHYRPLLIVLILAIEANDVFAYCCGKLIGGPKLLPATSPGKTVAGSVGALVLTSALCAWLFHLLYPGTAIDEPVRLATLGMMISGLGQLGDLTLSSIKRDAQIKDFSDQIPGHGGFLDRFDSLVLAPPAVYHYLSLYLGPLDVETPVRLLTGSS